MLKNVQRENKCRRVVRENSNIFQSFETLFLESLPLYRIRFDAFDVVADYPQPFGERPNARAEVDQIL